MFPGLPYKSHRLYKFIPACHSFGLIAAADVCVWYKPGGNDDATEI